MTGESRSKYFWIDVCRSCSYPLKVLQLTLRDKLGNISTAEDAAPPHLRARWYRSCKLRPRMLIEDFISYCSLPKSYLSPQVYCALKFSSGVLLHPPQGTESQRAWGARWLPNPCSVWMQITRTVTNATSCCFSTWAVTSVSPPAPPPLLSPFTETWHVETRKAPRIFLLGIFQSQRRHPGLFSFLCSNVFLSSCDHWKQWWKETNLIVAGTRHGLGHELL